ncbi:MAG: recQ [Acidobacteriales bacterium]|nr:recQ [Terriglobales bacterium]
MPSPDLVQQLQQLFGIESFRPGQQQAVESILNSKDVLCVMPTGAGKSLCYQLPALIQGGLTIVVSPLISLMEDQVQQLRDRNLPALLLNSSLEARAQREVITALKNGFSGLFYLSPERLFMPTTHALLNSLKPKLLVVDEAHCVSIWGHDFRPEYSRIGQVRQALASPPTIALTATATPEVRADIVHQLRLSDPATIITGFDRPNLSYQCRSFSRPQSKDEELLRIVRASTSGSGVIYCSTRKNVETLAASLSAALPKRSIIAYHAGMNALTRNKNQESFMQSASAVVIATNAFGMGINKPDIRFVIHNNIPGTLESYYQEAGRAGRDGLPAVCTLLFSEDDLKTQSFFIRNIGGQNGESDPAHIAQLRDRAQKKLDSLVRYTVLLQCRRKQIQEYFGDNVTNISDCTCDNCQRDPLKSRKPAAPKVAVSEHETLLIRKMLATIARSERKGPFGVTVLSEVLAGSKSENIRRSELDTIPTFGLLNDYRSIQIVAALHRLISTGLAERRDPNGVKFRPVIHLTGAGIAVMKGLEQVPLGLAGLFPHAGSTKKANTDSPLTEFDLSPEAKLRFDQLRAARTELAREKSLPAFVIMHDSTLRRIAQLAPADLIALGQIKGIGEKKLKLYGEALLRAMRD